MKVQAVDPETKHWLRAKVIEVGIEKTKLTWDGYSNVYDSWISNEFIRLPLTKRPLLRRNAIQKVNFPVRGDPKNLQYGDQIYDTVRKAKFCVETNDPFDSKVSMCFNCFLDQISCA